MNDTEKLTLWIGAFRYYCGRMTYAVSDFCDLLRKEWQNLPDHTRNLIRTELEKTFERDDKFRQHDHYAPLGADCDRKEWENVREIWETPNGEVRGASRPAGEASASTVVLDLKMKGQQ